MSIKKIIVVLFGAAVILSGCSSIPEGERVQARAVPHPAEPAETVRLDSAAASVLYCPDNGEMLYGHDIHEKRAIASITKIMTAVVALESGISPDKVVNITPAMYAEGSSMYLREGEKLTLCEIGMCLGRYDIRNQESMLDRVIRRFETILSRAEEEKRANARTQAYLGIISGIFVVIVLL